MIVQSSEKGMQATVQQYFFIPLCLGSSYYRGGETLQFICKLEI